MNELEALDFGSDPRQNMRLALSTLTPSQIVPKPNKYYVFVYKATTRGLRYDQHPLLVCGDVYQWGFTGMNVHWGEIRQYAWNGVVSNVYELTDEEFEFLQEIPLAYYKTA